MLNKIIKILIIVAVAMLTGGKIFAWSGSGTAGSPYLITSRSDLETLATNVNGGNDYSGKYFLVTEDIGTLTTVIGTYNGGEHLFCGDFDGGSHTITISMSDVVGGLFGYLGGNANIHNVTIAGTITFRGSNGMGGIAGYVWGSTANVTISNCINNTTLTNLGSPDCAGGILGKVKDYGGKVTIDNCTNNSNLSFSGRDYVGGIAGYTQSGSTITHCTNKGGIVGANYIAGIAGYCSYTNIENCKNEGNITGVTYIGGITGYLGGNTSHTQLSDFYRIIECENSGTITASGTSSVLTGGIAGYIVSCIYINSCFNTGNVNVAGYTAGGIVGEAYYGHKIRNCGNSGAVTSTSTLNSYWWDKGGLGGVIGYHFGQSSKYETVENCYNIGNVTGTTMISVGGIVGHSYRGVKILNCCNSGIVKGLNTSYSGALVGSNYTNSYIEYNYYLSSTNHTRNEKIGTSGESTYITNCASFEGGCSGGYTFKSPTSITVNDISYTQIIEALNAWINMQPNRSDYRRWLSSSSENNCAPIVQPLCQTLASPTLTVTPHNQRNELSWTEVANASSYNLVYNSSSLYSGGNRTFTHNNLTNGTEYCYQIMAVGDGTTYCTDNPIVEACGTPFCNQITLPTLTITETSDRQVTISWGNATGASSYNLYYGVNNPASGLENLYNAGTVTSPYTARRLTNGQRYYFAIKPIGSGDYCVDNPLSNVVQGTPNCP